MDTGALWVQPGTGEVYRIPDAAWASLRGGGLALCRPDGRRRLARPGRLRAFALGPAEGAQTLLNDPEVQAALLGLTSAALPPEGRWLVDAVRATDPQALLDALGSEGPEADPAARLSGLGTVLEQLDARGGAARLGELAAQAARQAALAPGSAAPEVVPPALALLAAVLARAAREDPSWRPAPLVGPAEDLTAATRAHVAARLTPPSPPSFNYADLLGREPGAPRPERDDETD